MSEIKLFNRDCLDLMSEMQDESIDIVCIDPPYLYLKNQKLEQSFDEQLFFSECKRILAQDGFIVMFGRGESFYRWNALLAELSFNFKEEIVWDKGMCSSPVLALSRFHESISIWSKGNGTINQSSVPYLEMKQFDLNSILQDMNRLKAALKNTKSLDAVIHYLENSAIKFEGKNKNKHKLRGDCNDGDRCARTTKSVVEGMREKSIIKVLRDHYSSIHPTQKPVRLLERLLAIVLPKKELHEITVADLFGGSFSTMEACHNMGINGISCEIDEEYFTLGENRIKSLKQKQPLLFEVES